MMHIMPKYVMGLAKSFARHDCDALKAMCDCAILERNAATEPFYVAHLIEDIWLEHVVFVDFTHKKPPALGPGEYI